MFGIVSFHSTFFSFIRFVFTTHLSIHAFCSQKKNFIIRMYKYMYVSVCESMYVHFLLIKMMMTLILLIFWMNVGLFFSTFFWFILSCCYVGMYLPMSIYIYEMNYEENISFKNFNKNIKIAAIAVQKKKCYINVLVLLSFSWKVVILTGFHKNASC